MINKMKIVGTTTKDAFIKKISYYLCKISTNVFCLNLFSFLFLQTC